ncbi:MAG: signal recognition particle-docking protein FtsY [Coleofasciculaceae cyanobacterium]
MVFNWFRRQFSTNEAPAQETLSDTPEAEQEPNALEEKAAEQDESDSTDKQSPAVSDDYLNWAKAAYKNIQQQKPVADNPTTKEPPEQEESTTPELTTELIEPTPESEDIATPEIPPATETAEPVGEVTEPQPETVSQETTQVTAEEQEESVVPEAEATAEKSPSSPSEPAATEADPTTPLPVWARQASEDRQARLERLKATAIDMPEPEVVGRVTQQTGESTGMAFDEDFLWSAEVLASQGRTPEDVSAEEINWLKRLRRGLGKTRRSLINQLKAIVGQGPLNQDAVMEIEALLLQADVGVEATDYIINTLQDQLRQEALPPEAAIAYLKTILRDLLDQPYQESYDPTFEPEKDSFNIWLLTGVNGAGKTTTIGKLAHMASQSGYKCLIGAADTFRAAAVEQVKVWGERSGTEVIANPGKNADPAAVVFDAITAAQARGVELLLVDTAGRLQNKKNLMEELAKIRRIIDKKAANAKVESLLVLDATLGQNGLRQAQVFSEAAKLSGVVLTKLDGTAKGGVALAVVQQLGLPIRFIGAGEGIEDLRPFSSYEFVEALLNG